MEPYANYLILIILSLVVISSHIFDIFSKLSKIPSVLLLLFTGVILRFIGSYFHFKIDLEKYLVLFGSIGLILIVLEGAMDLKISREKLPVIGRAFSSALIILLLSAGLVAFLIYSWVQCDVRNAVVNAIPIAVISSAIAIPTVRHLSSNIREFITYESIFSDILGIFLFNMVIQQSIFSFSAVAFSLANIPLVIIISLVTSWILAVLMNKIKIQVKFIFILSVLILIYSLGKLLHLPALFLILIFGLLLSNSGLMEKIRFLKLIRIAGIESDTEQFKLVIAEVTFLIRTFFFVIFGYMIDVRNILNIDKLLLAGCILACLFAIRYIYLKITLKVDILSTLFIAPRGLITILLFYSIPEAFKLEFMEQGIIFFVILVTSLLMMVGTLIYKDIKA
jgi:NhaP-type Na+/H+ or K+/H+ antiporter